MKRLDLEGKTKLVNISSIKDTGENIRVKEVKLQILDHGNTSIFHIDGALSKENEKFDLPSQHLPLGVHSDEKWAYIRNLKLADVNPSKVTLVIGADVPEAFIQRDLKKRWRWVTFTYKNTIWLGNLWKQQKC